MSQTLKAPVRVSQMTPPFVPFIDQAIYLAATAGGQHAVIQVLWRYNRPVDFIALARFREGLVQGRLARLIRSARLPFGRHQWVSAPAPVADFKTDAAPLDPLAIQAWADAQVALPLDPSRGPGWNLTMQAFSDGSSVISFVVSHCISDGMSTALAIKEAARNEPFATPASASAAQGAVVGLAGEVWRAAKDVPATVQALGHLVRKAYAARKDHKAFKARTRSVALTPPKMTAGAQDRLASYPSFMVHLPASVWDAKARALGTNRLTLLTALTATLAQSLGRVREDHVTLLHPVNQRTSAADTGGNCVKLATLKVAVTDGHIDLKGLKRQLQSTLVQTRRDPEPMEKLLPLVPFIPGRAFSAAGNLALGTGLPVTCSYLGDWSDEVTRIDGTGADSFGFRGVDRLVRVQSIEAREGVASVFASVIAGRFCLSFVAYQPGLVETHEHLRSLAHQILSKYDLHAQPFDA